MKNYQKIGTEKPEVSNLIQDEEILIEEEKSLSNFAKVLQDEGCRYERKCAAFLELRKFVLDNPIISSNICQVVKNYLTNIKKIAENIKCLYCSMNRIAIDDKVEDVRRIALKFTNCPIAISYVAMKDKEEKLRKKAIKKTNCQLTISYVAMNDEKIILRKKALKKSNCLHTLNHVAMNDSDSGVRKKAIKKMKRPLKITKDCSEKKIS